MTIAPCKKPLTSSSWTMTTSIRLSKGRTNNTTRIKINQFQLLASSTGTWSTLSSMEPSRLLISSTERESRTSLKTPTKGWVMKLQRKWGKATAQEPWSSKDRTSWCSSEGKSSDHFTCSSSSAFASGATRNTTIMRASFSSHLQFLLASTYTKSNNWMKRSSTWLTTTSRSMYWGKRQSYRFRQLMSYLAILSFSKMPSSYHSKESFLKALRLSTSVHLQVSLFRSSKRPTSEKSTKHKMFNSTKVLTSSKEPPSFKSTWKRKWASFNLSEKPSVFQSVSFAPILQLSKAN